MKQTVRTLYFIITETYLSMSLHNTNKYIHNTSHDLAVNKGKRPTLCNYYIHVAKMKSTITS